MLIVFSKVVDDLPLPASFVLRAAELKSPVRYHAMSLPIPESAPESARSSSVYCFASPIVALASTSSSQVLGAISSPPSPASTTARYHYVACALLNGDVLVWSARTAQLLVFIEPNGLSSCKKQSTDSADASPNRISERDKVVGMGFVHLHAILFVCTADGTVRVFS